MKRRIIVEGPSERAYMQRLASFLESEMPLEEDGYSSRLIFYPTITNNRIGGGSYNLVHKAYKTLCPQNPKTPLMVWVDLDIYIRNSNQRERASAAGYKNKGTMPDFHFSVMNFEDFLALHFDEVLFVRWKMTFDLAGHFVVPLHSDKYDKLWQPIWTEFLIKHPEVGIGEYKKGSIPEGFITVGTLNNLRRNILDLKISKLFEQYSSPSTPVFPIWFADILHQIYPVEFP